MKIEKKCKNRMYKKELVLGIENVNFYEKKDNWNEIYSYFNEKNFAIIKTPNGVGVMGGYYFDNYYEARIRFNNDVITIEKDEVKLATKKEILNYIFGDEQ